MNLLTKMGLHLSMWMETASSIDPEKEKMKNIVPNLNANVILRVAMEKCFSPGAIMSTCGESLMENEIC